MAGVFRTGREKVVDKPETTFASRVGVLEEAGDFDGMAGVDPTLTISL